jgi:Protein of unknown function (DUF559)
VISRAQLLELGLTAEAVRHRVATGRLHRWRWNGIYAAGRPQLSRHGAWMAALLACGSEAVLSHDSAAALWGILAFRPGVIHVSVPMHVRRERTGIDVHRREGLRPEEVATRDCILVTAPALTLVDIAPRIASNTLEAAVNEADKLDLIDPQALRAALDGIGPRRGAGILRRLLDRLTFTLTASELERRFLPLARKAGLGLPVTGERVNGFEVDFYWPELKLIVETDGLRYHRTPAQQARDRLRDQTHLAAGFTPLRFTHAQIRFEPRYVEATLAKVLRQLRSR